MTPLRKTWCRECGGFDGQHTADCDDGSQVEFCCQARDFCGEQCDRLEHGPELKHQIGSTHSEWQWRDPLDHARYRLTRAKRELAEAEAEMASVQSERST